MFGGFERPHSGENGAKIELGGQMEDQDGPEMAARGENAGQYDPMMAPTLPQLAPMASQVASKMVRGTLARRRDD